MMLTYLVSGKRELGTAAVQCEGGCTCGGFQLEAKSPHPITVRFQKRIKMVAAKDCQLRLRVKGGYFQARKRGLGRKGPGFSAFSTRRLLPCALVHGAAAGRFSVDTSP